MKRIELLESELRRALIVVTTSIVIASGVASVALVVSAIRLAEYDMFGLLGLLYLVTPLVIVIVAALSIRGAGRFKALMLMVAALRTAPDGHWCTEGELAGVARLSLDRARPVLAWLVRLRSRGLPVVSRVQRGLYHEFTLAPAGGPWADRMLGLAGWN